MHSVYGDGVGVCWHKASVRLEPGKSCKGVPRMEHEGTYLWLKLAI